MSQLINSDIGFLDYECNQLECLQLALISDKHQISDSQEIDAIIQAQTIRKIIGD